MKPTEDRFARLRWPAVVLMCTALAACGGGDDDAAAPSPAPAPAPAPGPAPSPGPAPAPSPAPAPLSGQYQLEAPVNSAAAMVAQANRMGEQGYAYVSGVASSANDQGTLYFKSSDRAGTKLTYDSEPLADSLSAMVARLNARGASGWAYKSAMGFSGGTNIVSMFVKDSTRPATYSYLNDALQSNWTAELAQFNDRGNQGYRFIGPAIHVTSGAAGNLYMRTSAPSATYSYVTQPVLAADSNASQVEAVLDNMGQQRRIFVGPYNVGNSNALLFEGSSLQTAALDYDVTAIGPGENLQQAVARANAKAAQGYVHVGDVANATGAGFSIYVKGMTVPQRHPLSGIVYP